LQLQTKPETYGRSYSVLWIFSSKQFVECWACTLSTLPHSFNTL
jgi:hypothetical protein